MCEGPRGRSSWFFSVARRFGRVRIAHGRRRLRHLSRNLRYHHRIDEPEEGPAASLRNGKVSAAGYIRMPSEPRSGSQLAKSSGSISPRRGISLRRRRNCWSCRWSRRMSFRYVPSSVVAKTKEGDLPKVGRITSSWIAYMCDLV